VTSGGGFSGGRHRRPQFGSLRLPARPNPGAWGDDLSTPKPDSTLRICFQNVGGIPHDNVHIKNSQIISFVNSSETDILALSEINVGWRHLPIHQRMHERTRGWWEALHLSLGYYQSDPLVQSAFQPGGTAVLSINQAAHRVHSSGSDISGLGRWSWTRYSGKGEVALRVVSAYRPVYNPTGPLSVYNRQRAHFYRLDDDRCPRLAISEDLVREISI